MTDENLEQSKRIEELEKDLETARAEILELKRARRKKFITSNSNQPIIMIVPARNTIGPNTNSPETGGGLIQTRGLKTKSPDASEILKRVQADRGKVKKEK